MRFLSRLVLAVAVLSCGSGEPMSTSITGTPTEPTQPTGPVIAPVIGFSKRSSSANSVSIPYQVWAPQNYVATSKWPIVVALAGSEERGSDGDKQAAVGLGVLVRAQPNFPAVVIFPQVPSDETGRLAFDQAIYQIIADVSRDYNGDPARVYLTGLSYGGTESFNILYANTSPFAGYVAVAPGICSRCIQAGATLDVAQTLVAQKLKAFPIWIFQGDQDTAIPVPMTQALVQAFRTAGATSSLKYTEYPGLGHVIWDKVYADPAVWTWLFAQRR